LATDLPSDLNALVLVDPDTDVEDRLGPPQKGTVNVFWLSCRGSTQDGTFDVSEESMAEVAAHVLRTGYTHIVHALAFESSACTNARELDRRVRKNLYSLFLLSQALMKAGIRAKLVVLSYRACVVADGAEVLAPENSSLAGLAKVIGREFPYLKCRVQDIDDSLRSESLWQEITRAEPGLHVIRNGVSYREVFEELPQIEQDAGDYLKAGGTYLITGGTGGIGLAVIEEFVRQQPDINLVLVSRSGAPPQTDWAAVLKTGEDWRTVRTVSTLLAAQKQGTRIDVHAADVGDPQALSGVVSEVIGKFGTIDGVVHAAGIPGQNMISQRKLEDFHRVVSPKIYGAYILNSLCPAGALDFIVYFSSVAVVFPASGQGDYAAANYYLDTLARAARQDDTHVVCIDWVAWRDTGMAVDYGSRLDTTFKALPTEIAIGILDRMLRSKRRRVFAGEVNYDGNLVHIFKSFDVTLSDGVTEKMGKAEDDLQDRLRAAAEAKRKEIDLVDVELSGSPDCTYREAEVIVARCFAHALGYRTVDVTDDFFNIGGDSIMATTVASNIAMCLGVEFDAADLLMERTVTAVVDSLEACGALN
jgi:NAD(P)-dependent dehydrogenase (short-subunit alcohol dehydrogenase family)/acyl carrier protein